MERHIHQHVNSGGNVLLQNLILNVELVPGMRNIKIETALFFCSHCKQQLGG